MINMMAMLSSGRHTIKHYAAWLTVIVNVFYYMQRIQVEKAIFFLLYFIPIKINALLTQSHLSKLLENECLFFGTPHTAEVIVHCQLTS